MNLNYIGHKLTARHLRVRRGGPTRLAVCHCGWKVRFMRPSFSVRLRMAACCVLRHRWDDELHEVTIGPAGAPDEEFTVVDTYRQCERCYKCASVS